MPAATEHAHGTFAVEVDDQQARLTTTVLVVMLGLHPFRLDVRRSDGSVVLETAVDDEDRPWAYATLNDSFTSRRGDRWIRAGVSPR